ncbi:MAG TPA: MBL fold metallo-hydrolase [Bryobacteraceae bacterium]|jgi:glyoxylase-like metal-dependent hydrolase (beta-lactamase superfamily II)
MARRRTWILGALTALAGIAAAAYYWEFLESPSPGAAQFSLDLKEVRRLADSMPGDRPTGVRFEHVMDFQAPTAATITGGGLAQSTMWGIAYLLIYPDHTAMLDTAMNSLQAKALGSVSAFYAEPYSRLIKAMSNAGLIFITHEHADHIGGIAAHPDAVRLFKSTVTLTSEQVNDPEHAMPALLPRGVLNGYRPLKYDRYTAIAPGIALIKAPGHSPGSQMVFVHLAGGTEILFLGDVAWTMRNVELVRGRPRFVSNSFGEDRKAVINQLAAIHALTLAEPNIVIVPGHDGGTITDLVKRGVMKEGFE